MKAVRCLSEIFLVRLGVDSYCFALGEDAFQWSHVHQYDIASAWLECPNAEWLLYLATVIEVPRRMLVRTSVNLAELALEAFTAEQRLITALNAARGWAGGEKVSKKQLYTARDAASGIAWDFGRFRQYRRAAMAMAVAWAIGGAVDDSIAFDASKLAELTLDAYPKSAHGRIKRRCLDEVHASIALDLIKRHFRRWQRASPQIG